MQQTIQQCGDTGRVRKDFVPFLEWTIGCDLPYAARETSNTVGNLLSVIDLNNKAKAAPSLPQPQPVPPQILCSSGINPGGGLVIAKAEICKPRPTRGHTR
jgi:hypothetical protein